jgi:hypothetical protein
MVVPVPCVGELDYSRTLRSWWRTSRTIVNVEHDMEVSDELIQALLDCPHPFCTHAYTLFPVSTGKRAHYAQAASKPHIEDWIAAGVEWCAFTGIGFCKITPEARARRLGESTWQFVDLAVSAATDCPVHVHWPAVSHYHV